MIEYINKHGKITNNRVIYDISKVGPFKGLKNGDRKYKMDFTTSRNMGTFYLIAGASAMLSYAGQRKTCGRCYSIEITEPVLVGQQRLIVGFKNFTGILAGS